MKVVSPMIQFSDMITNFDKETAPLNDLEEQAADIIARCLLAYHRGAESVVSAEQIGIGMMNTYPIFCVTDKNGNKKPYLTGPRVRKIVNRLRVDDRVPLLIATNAGYYVAYKPQEIRDYIRSVKERISAMQQMVNCMERQFHKAFEGTHYIAPINV